MNTKHEIDIQDTIRIDITVTRPPLWSVRFAIAIFLIKLAAKALPLDAEVTCEAVAKE